MKYLPLKLIVLLGGFAGFSASYFSSLAHGAQPTPALLDGSVGCLVGAFIVRGGIALFLQSLQHPETANASVDSEEGETPQSEASSASH